MFSCVVTFVMLSYFLHLFFRKRTLNSLLAPKPRYGRSRTRYWLVLDRIPLKKITQVHTTAVPQQAWLEASADNSSITKTNGHMAGDTTERTHLQTYGIRCLHRILPHIDGLVSWRSHLPILCNVVLFSISSFLSLSLCQDEHPGILYMYGTERSLIYHNRIHRHSRLLLRPSPAIRRDLSPN
jgi:hypothetical protein